MTLPRSEGVAVGGTAVAVSVGADVALASAVGAAPVGVDLLAPVADPQAIRNSVIRSAMQRVGMAPERRNGALAIVPRF
jgi:hypothetical protein